MLNLLTWLFKDKIEITKRRLTNELEFDTYSKRKEKPYKTNDGHKVRSRGEAMIDNWLYDNKIVHAYEKIIPHSDYISDFYLPESNIYIELWADYKNSLGDKYEKQKQEKIEHYKAHKLDMVEVHQEDLNDLEIKLRSKLKRYK